MLIENSFSVFRSSYERDAAVTTAIVQLKAPLVIPRSSVVPAKAGPTFPSLPGLTRQSIFEDSCEA
jgi:hypothetical protein